MSTINIDGVQISTLKEAAIQDKEDIDAHFGKYADVNKDSFTALNTAFSYEGVFLKVTKNTIIDKPIILHYGAEGRGNENFIQTRNLIVVESGAQLNLIESYTSDFEGMHYSNHVSEIVAGANAHVNIFKFQNQAGECYHIDNSFVSQARDSVVKSYTFTLEGKMIRNNLNIVLEEENSEAHMYGL